MGNYIKITLCLVALIAVSCGAQRRADRLIRKSQKVEQHKVQKGTPNEEDFVTLAPPVTVEVE